MTAAELAAILATYGDRPVKVRTVAARSIYGGNRYYETTTTHEGLHIEIDPDGAAVVTAYSGE